MKIDIVDIKYLALPLIAIPVIIIGTILVVRNGYDQVKIQIEKLKDVQKDERVLEEKLSILKKIQAGVLEKTNVSVVALQEGNPSPYTLSLIRKYSQDKLIPLEKIDIKGKRSEDQQEEISQARFVIKSTQTEDTDEQSVISFLDSLEASIPLTSFDEVLIEKDTKGLSFEVQGYVYWSEFPTELPPLTQPIKDLTDTENTLFSEIAGLSKPTFSTLDPLGPNMERENPFF